MRGHIRKRGNIWAVVVDLGRDDDGKRRQKWQSGFRTKRDAERALNEILNRIGAGGYIDPGRQTVGAYFRECSRRSRKRCGQDVGELPHERGTPHHSEARHPRAPSTGAAWVLLATTGMRRGELLGLRWSDIDFETGRAAVRQTLSSVGGKVTFSTPKSAKSRRNIALDPPMTNALRHHRDTQDKERVTWAEIYTDLDLVFCREDGSVLRPDTITRQFRERSRRAGVPQIRLHDVRHSYASLGLAAGAHPKIMAERLGHATVGITLDTYSHVAPALARRAADDLAALILGDDEDPP